MLTLPRFARSIAVSLPMPVLPPVIMTVLPSIRLFPVYIAPFIYFLIPHKATTVN